MKPSTYLVLLSSLSTIPTLARSTNPSTALPSTLHSRNKNSGQDAGMTIQIFIDAKCTKLASAVAVKWDVETTWESGFGSYTVSRRVARNEQLDFSLPSTETAAEAARHYCGLFLSTVAGATKYVSVPPWSRDVHIL